MDEEDAACPLCQRCFDNKDEIQQLIDDVGRWFIIKKAWLIIKKAGLIIKKAGLYI